MTWTLANAVCDRCGNTASRLYPAFGKHICGNCRDTRPHKMRGNAGMVNSGQYHLVFNEGLSLKHVPKSDGLFGKLFFEHYPGSKGIPGRSLCYLVYRGLEVVGIIGVASPPHNYKIFREYFEAEDDNCFVNNNVFRLILQEKNLGTKVLKEFRRVIYADYLEKYGERLLGIVTFVEPPRTGALYKADNWDYLGMTQGKRMRRDKETWQKVFTQETPKLIYAYTYPVKYHSPLDDDLE